MRDLRAETAVDGASSPQPLPVAAADGTPRATALQNRQASPDYGDLKGKVAWVTGASRGLGRALALGLADSGAKVLLTARSERDLADLARDIDGDVEVIVGSVTDPRTSQRSVEQALTRFGRLDVLVNMAGINPALHRSEELPDALWQEVLDVNLSGTFFACREAGRVMLEAGSGSIINVSSVHGSTGVRRMLAYAASKGGVETLTKALALEWAERGVRVNCLAPGYFRTSLTEPFLSSRHGVDTLASIPMGRVGEVSELVGAALFLASDMSSYMTGSIITVDGGWTAQ